MAEIKLVKKGIFIFFLFEIKLYLYLLLLSLDDIITGKWSLWNYFREVYGHDGSCL
jgi:hypothetical protein